MNPEQATIDQLSEDFQNHWRLQPITVEEFLEQCSYSDDVSVSLKARLIKQEIELRRADGETCSANEYQSRFPDVDAAVLSNLFSMPAPPPVSVLKPLLPKRYQPIKQIGKGGIGSVWQVDDRDMERTLAVKVLHTKLEKENAANLRLKREAMLTGSLQHPGIPPVFEHGTLVGGSSYFAMKLVEGETLDKVISKLSQTESLAVFRQIAEAVGFAHSKNIIHRDLKPQNVMVGAFGEVQIMDWGMARRLGADEPMPTIDRQESLSGSKVDTVSALGDASVTEGSSPSHELTRVGEVLGTPAYMAPEQARGESSLVSLQSDVFGLGAILFAMLTGKSLYEGYSSAEIIGVAAKGDLGEAFSVLESAKLDIELEDLCKDCLQPQPVNRPADASIVAERIVNYQNNVRDRLRKVELEQQASLVKATEQKKRTRAISWLSGLAILLTTAGLIGVSWQWGKATEARSLAVKRLGETRETVDDFYLTLTEEGKELALTPGTKEIRRVLLRKAKNYYTNFVSEFADDEDAWLDMAKAYERLILISSELEPASDEVFELIDQQKTLCKKLIGKNEANANNPEYQRLLQGAQYWLARQLSQKGEHEKSIEASKICAEHIENWIAVEDSLRSKLQAAKNIHNIGTEQRFLKQHSKASEQFSEALRLAEPLWIANREDAECAINFATMNNSMGVHYGWYAKPRDSQKAIEHLNKSVEIIEGSIKANPDRLENKRLLTQVLNNLGMLQWDDEKGVPDRNERARLSASTFERGIALTRELVKDHPSVPLFRAKLARQLSNFASFQGFTGQPEQRIETLRSSADVGFNVAMQHPQVKEYSEKAIELLDELSGAEGLGTNGADAAKKCVEVFANRVPLSKDDAQRIRWALRKAIVEKNSSPMLLDLTKSFDQLSSKKPTQIVARAMALFRNDRIDDARKTLELNELTDDSLYQFAKGLILAKQGKTEDAGALLKQAQESLVKDKFKGYLAYYRLSLEEELQNAIK